MPQQKIENLISRLHDEFGTEEASAAQVRLMQGLKRHIHEEGTPVKEDPRLVDTLQALFEEFGDEHPGASRLLRETINALRNMGI